MAQGDVYYRMHNYKSALSYESKAYELCLTAGDKTTQIRVLDKLATLYDLTNKIETATEMLDKALALCVDDPSLRFKIIYNYGTHLLRQEKGSEALSYFLETEKNAQAMKHAFPRFLCELYNNIAGCYWFMQELELTRVNLDKSIDYAKKLDNRDFLMQTLLNQTHYLILMKDYDRAQGIIEDAIDYYKQNSFKQQEILANKAMAFLFESKGDYKSALEITRRNEKNYQAQISALRAEMSAESELKIGALNKKYESGLYNYQCFGKKQKAKETCGFIGASASSRKVLESALLAAQHPNANVFIFGESGTGKDVLANIIHYNSIRKDSPFVAINVSALSAGVLESELFGHVKGAFTGAINNTKGYLHKANKGTLFLDEITEMPSELQSKLLRVVETMRFTPVGSNDEVSFDSRIIGTTNRDIYEAIRSNSFRLDLFHRLNTIEIYIPPLRDRKDDIEELLMHYTEFYAQQNKVSIPKISDDFVKLLKRHSFPGNVRELKNLVERLYILCGSEYWTEGDLGSLNVTENPRHKSTKGWGDPEVERIIHALEQAQGKQKDAAKILHLSESTLCRRIVKYNLEAYTLRHRTP